MRTDRPTLIVSLCLLIALLPGCAVNSAPGGWLRQPEETQTTAFGGWMEVKYTATGETRHARGELIAVEPDSVYILSAYAVADTELIAISKNAISKAKLTAYRANASNLALWTVAGMLTTLSHGYFLTFTLPGWFLFGTLATAGQTRAPQITGSNRTNWENFAQYARFPQGLPADLDRKALALAPAR